MHLVHLVFVFQIKLILFIQDRSFFIGQERPEIYELRKGFSISKLLKAHVQMAGDAPVPMHNAWMDEEDGRLVVRCWAESTQLPPRPLRAFWTLLLPDYQEPRLLIQMMGVLMQMRS